jgi:ADP-ribose pyrophosphatase YjhB (NUDIX family)
VVHPDGPRLAAARRADHPGGGHLLHHRRRGGHGHLGRRALDVSGGTVEPGETVEQALSREVAEEACATVLDRQYLASQHVSDPTAPDGRTSYYQTRWWASVAVDPWRPAHEMTGRRLVAPAAVLSTLFWPEKEIAARLIDQAQAAQRRHSTPGSR